MNDLINGEEAPQGTSSKVSQDLIMAVSCCGYRSYVNLPLLTFWVRLFFVMGGCFIHYRMFSTIVGLYLLDASNMFLHSCDK